MTPVEASNNNPVGGAHRPGMEYVAAGLGGVHLRRLSIEIPLIPSAVASLAMILRNVSRVSSLFAMVVLQSAAMAAGPVINEIFYHAPNDLEDLEWVEIHNPQDQTVDISGWRFSKGIDFTFPAGSRLEARGFLVLAHDRDLFAEYYSFAPAGQFKGSLKNAGETLELNDASGRQVDRVEYKDQSPWPQAPDGQGSSLERITPTHAGIEADNWAPSSLPLSEEPAGTPGKPNNSFSANFPPLIKEVTVSPSNPLPGQPLRVEAQVQDPEVESVEVRFQIVQPGKVSAEEIVAMRSEDGKKYSATIPPQESDRLVRVRVRAANRSKAERYFPSPNDLNPALSFYFKAPEEKLQIPLAFVIHTNPEAARARSGSAEERGGPPEFGGMDPDRMMAQQMLDMGLRLPTFWFECTINRDLDDAGFRALRPLFREKDAATRRFRSEFLASKDFKNALRTLPERIEAFQGKMVEEITAALPEKHRGDFTSWYKSHSPMQQGPEDIMKRVLNIEGIWWAVNERFDLSEEQRKKLQTSVKTAATERSEQIPMLQKVMQGQGDFQELTSAVGAIETRLLHAFRTDLGTRQYRYLQEWKNDQGSPMRPPRESTEPALNRGDSAFVVMDAKSGACEVFDFVRVSDRKAGYKVHFPKGRPYRGMSTINLLFEYNDRFVLAEPLAFELYRRVGNAACLTDFVRLTMDGQMLGYHLLVEQVNGAFLRRNRLNTDGDLYKLLWYGGGVVGQHEKQDHPDRDHTDLVRLVDELNKTEGAAQWEIIRRNFNVEQVATYFAVNACLSHWDGFFNNYFTYHDRQGTGKWEMYPWDQDKTWGFYDGLNDDDVFTDMPISFGMKGDQPPGGESGQFGPGRWWRPPGFFSGPLLANPEFRKIYLRKVRHILDDIYTEAAFFPVIDQLAARLEPEVDLRAKATGGDVDQARQQFQRNIASLKRHLVERRKFLLNSDEIRALQSRN